MASTSSMPQPAAIAPTHAALYTNPTNGCQIPTIVTRKEWVIPPRPKPGRKPSTDTPPTKRKAQNRAAQRAFRERRAARVGELEEQLEETKEEQSKRETDMRNKLTRLEAEVLRFNTELQSWRSRCDTLDQIADYERREKEAALAELARFRNNSAATSDAVPLMRLVRRQESDTKPLTPAAEPDEHMDPSTPLEIDFTSHFSSKPEPIHLTQDIQHTARQPVESCGFCKDGTYCMCAASAAIVEQEDSLQLAPLSNDILMSEVTPPPSDTDMDGTAGTKLRAFHPTKMHRSIPSGGAANSCTNGPGTCQQCQNDPKSGLFCRSMAALREAPVTSLPAVANACANGPGSCQQCQSDPKARAFCLSLSAQQQGSSTMVSSMTESGCCGGNSASGACCKTQMLSGPPPSLSVADTYKTLSMHRNFDQASDELNTWLGRLHTAPQPQEHAGRAPMEVEAASVMGVLKLFDRRFGRG